MPSIRCLLGLEAEVVETGRLGEERRLRGQVGQRRPPPEREGVVERRDRHAGIDRQRCPRVAEERVEPAGVQLGRPHHQQVARRTALEPLLADRTPQVGHVGVE